MNKIPTVKDWTTITHGTPEFPKLYSFEDEKRNREELKILQSVAQRILIAAQGPASYEEFHRQFANWRAAIDEAMGVKPRWIRLRSARDVNKLKAATLELLENAIDPTEFLRMYMAKIARFRDFSVSRYSVNYVFSDGVVHDTIVSIQAQRSGFGRPQQTESRVSSYEGQGDAISEAKHLLGRAGHDTSAMTDREIMTAIEAAKQIKRGTPGFIPQRVKPAAQILAGVAQP